MPNYRRAYVPGGTFFLTIVTYQRRPILESVERVSNLRAALRQVMCETPFRVLGAVVLPDHVHFIWSLPRGDTDYSRRIGRLKVIFTRSSRDERGSPTHVSDSRRKHRESDVWQRRFWKHTVNSEEEFEQVLHYIHYNAVKHGLVPCPHLWSFSSFGKWVRAGLYSIDWGCSFEDRNPILPTSVNDGVWAGE